MAWVGDFLYSYAQVHIAGFCLNCPESPATVMTDLREIGPTYYFGPPRVYENILTQVMIRIEDASWLRSEEHTSELQSLTNLVCRLLLEKKKDGRHVTGCPRIAGRHGLL